MIFSRLQRFLASPFSEPNSAVMMTCFPPSLACFIPRAFSVGDGNVKGGAGNIGRQGFPLTLPSLVIFPTLAASLGQCNHEHKKRKRAASVVNSDPRKRKVKRRNPRSSRQS